MTEPEDRVPGVTLWMSKATYMRGAAGDFLVKAALNGTASDLALWEAVQKKLEAGIRIYEEDDFHTAVVHAVKMDVSELRAEITELERQLRQEKDARQLAEEQLARFKEPLEAFGRALQGGR
jgi:hypothetical protein